MVVPLWAPLSKIVRARISDAGARTATMIATVSLAAVAAGLLVSAGLAALTQLTGFPAAALVFAVLFALLALAAHLIGRAVSARHAARARAAQTRALNQIVTATALGRSAAPLLPLAALVAAFIVARGK